MTWKLPLGVLFLAAATACGNDDSGTNESGFGTVVIHTFLDTGGPAAGVETYIVRRSTEVRKTTDQIGNVTYDNVPAGSWDAGFSESSTYVPAAGQSSRRTVDVSNDRTTELSFTVKRQTPPR